SFSVGNSVVKNGITRRAVLAMMPGTLAATSQNPAKNVRPLPSVGGFVRFSDPTTENAVVRLTNPASTSILPAPTNRFVSVRERFLIFSSERSGKLQPFRVDLRTGMLAAVAEATSLDARSLCLDRKERILHFIDGGTLRAINVAHRREERPIAKDVSAFSLGSAPSEFWVIRDGQLEYLVDGKAR